MEAYNNKKPLIAQGWLRAVVFIIFYLGIIILVGTLVVLFASGAANSLFNKERVTVPNPHLYTNLIIIVNGIVSFLIVWLFRRVIDRKSLVSLGFEWGKNGKHAAVGFFLGICLLCIGTFILYFSKHLQWTEFSFNASDLFTGLITMLIVALYEEVVFRGYILNNLLESINKWAALLISAFIFTLVHAANPNFSLLSAFNIFLAGILLGINYIYTKNLWYAIMFHFSWDFFMGPVLGYEVSGVKAFSSSVFEQEVHGSELLTGGHFGLEGSLISTVLYILAIVMLYFMYTYKTRIGDTNRTHE